MSLCETADSISVTSPPAARISAGGLQMYPPQFRRLGEITSSYPVDYLDSEALKCNKFSSKHPFNEPLLGPLSPDSLITFSLMLCFCYLVLFSTSRNISVSLD